MNFADWEDGIELESKVITKKIVLSISQECEESGIDEEKADFDEVFDGKLMLRC